MLQHNLHLLSIHIFQHRQPLAGSQERISDNVLIGHLLSTLPETFATIAGVVENPRLNLLWMPSPQH